MTDRELMQQALEALEGAEALLLSMGLTHLIVYGDAEKAITALREALAEQHEMTNIERHERNLQKFLAEQPAQPYKGIADHTNQATNGRLKIDPVTGDVGIGTPIAEPVQEPVAEADTGGGMKIDASAPLVMTTHPAFQQQVSKPMTKQEWLSYIEKTWDTAQREAWGETPSREWVGLTDEEIGYIIDDYSNVKSSIRAAELQLKEKNA